MVISSWGTVASTSVPAERKIERCFPPRLSSVNGTTYQVANLGKNREGEYDHRGLSLYWVIEFRCRWPATDEPEMRGSAWIPVQFTPLMP